MAAPQYRPIDAPDFSTALRGYQMFSDQLNNAFTAARGTLNDLQARQTQTADQEVLARALQQQDAGGFRDALANGSLLSGINPNRLSAGVLTGLQDRVGTLLNQGRTRQQLEQGALDLESGRYDFGRTQDSNQRMDAARTAQAALYEAAARGDAASVARIRQENAGVLGNLNADQSLALAQGSQGLLKGEQNQRIGEFGLTRDQYNLSIDQRDDRETRSAKTLANDVLRRSANGEDARAVLESMSGLDPNVRAMATQLVQGAFPGTYGPQAVGGPSMGGGQPVSAGAQAIPFAETRGYVANIMANAPALSGTNRQKAEQLLPALIQQESGGRDGAVSSKGARGRTQVMPKTGADPGFGVKPMQNQTPQEYERFATDYLTAMLDRYDGNPEAALAAYNAGPGNVDNWRKSGTALTGASNQLQSTASVVDVLTRSMQDTSTGIANDFAQTVGDTRDAGAVVNELVGEGGVLAGSNKGDVLREIRRVMNDGNVNAATAAAVVRRNLTNSPSTAAEYLQYGFNRLTSPLRSSPNLGGGFRLNDDGVDSDIRALRDGSALGEFQSNQERGAAVAAITQAQSALEAAQADLARQTQLAVTLPGLRAQLPRYQARVQAAQQRLDAVREAQRGLDQLRPNFPDRTQPQPVAQAQGGGSNRTTQILQQAAETQPLPSGIPREGFRGQGRNW